LANAIGDQIDHLVLQCHFCEDRELHEELEMRPSGRSGCNGVLVVGKTPTSIDEGSANEPDIDEDIDEANSNTNDVEIASASEGEALQSKYGGREWPKFRWCTVRRPLG
jgi:hypothetical protein